MRSRTSCACPCLNKSVTESLNSLTYCVYDDPLCLKLISFVVNAYTETAPRPFTTCSVICHILSRFEVVRAC